MTLGLLILGIAGLFILSGKRSEYPVNENEGPIAKGLGLSGSYWDDSLNRQVDYKIRRGRYGLLLLVLVGFVGGFFGLGGGWSVVPIFNLLMYVPLKLSAGCSGLLLALGNAAAIWPYIAAGALIPLFVAPWVLGQVIGGIIGAYVLSAVRAGFVRILLIALLLLTGLKLIGRGMEGVFMFQIPFIQPMHDPGQSPVQQSPIARIYVEIVYWCTILASFMVIISTTCAFLGMPGLLEPAYLFSSIWTGKEAAEIWLNSTGQLPDTHWYLYQLWNADSLAMLGIVLGIFSVVPASFAASVIFFKQGQKFFGIMGLLTGLLILLPCLGLI